MSAEFYSRRPCPRLALALALLLSSWATGCVGFAPEPRFAAEATAGDGPAAHGSTVEYRYTMFSTQGVPLLTNQFAVAKLISASGLGYRISNASAYNPASIHLGVAESPFGATFDSYFIGRTTGEVFETPLIPANATITGTDGTRVVIPRVFGPFLIEEHIPLSVFRAKFPNATEDDVIQLNARFQALVLDISPSQVRFRILVEDQIGYPYPELGSSARIRTELLNETHFREVVEVAAGATFHRRNDQLEFLKNGSYLVERVLADEIELARLRAPPSYYTLNDVFFVVEIVRVSR